jgi:hypothetical protein
MIINTSFSIEVEVIEAFRNACKEICINQNAYIQMKMKEIIKLYEEE